MAADIVFEMPTNRFGLVEIKADPLLPSVSVAEVLNRRRSIYEQFSSQRPVGVVYIVAGRRNHVARVASTTASTGSPPITMRLVSWDDIIDRLRGAGDSEQESEFEILLVEIVHFSRNLLRSLLSNPARLLGIDDRKFEELVATLLFDLGVKEVDLTPARQDGGRDIIVTHVDPATGSRQTYLVECKHWVSGARVTMRWALSLLDVARKENAHGAILLSSSGFGPKLLEQEATLSKKGLFLKDGKDLVNWVSIWERQYGAILVQPVDPKTIFGLS
jgi:hypothetical protein